jgi:hypothetical protein
MKRRAGTKPCLVVAGLVPAISLRRARRFNKRDARDELAHDDSNWGDSNHL